MQRTKFLTCQTWNLRPDHQQMEHGKYPYYTWVKVTTKGEKNDNVNVFVLLKFWTLQY